MELSILVAKILSVTYISAGIAAITGKISFGRIMEDLEKSQGLTFVSGFFTLVLGMILVTYHNRWASDWTVLITLVAWASVLKGVRLIAFPQSVTFLKGWFKDSKIWGIVLLGLGIVFGYFGFIS